VLVCGIGAVVGAPGASYAMLHLGTEGFLWYFVVVHASMGAFAIYRMTRRAATPMEDQETLAFTPQPAAMAPAFAPETFLEMSEGPEEAQPDSPPA